MSATSDRARRLQEKLGPDLFEAWEYAARTWRPEVARRATPDGLFKWLVAEGWLHETGDFTDQFYAGIR